MRTVDEIRNRLIEQLRFALWRPSMSAGDASGAELLAQHILSTLCFMDDRKQEWEIACSVYTRGCLRVCGQFEFQHRPFPHYVNEVASVYAELAFSLGYFTPGRLLSVDERSRLAAAVDAESFRNRDWTHSELQAVFGAPSHLVVGGATTVSCYGCEATEIKWVFFDLARQSPGSDYWLQDPLARDFRNDHLNEMRLLPMGEHWINAETGGAPKVT